MQPLWADIDTPEVGIDKLVVIMSGLAFCLKLAFSLLCGWLSRIDRPIIT